MTLQWKDADFEMHTGLWKPPTTCLAVQPGVVDFPARCVGPRDDHTLHRSCVGYAGGRPTDITYWTDDE